MSKFLNKLIIFLIVMYKAIMYYPFVSKKLLYALIIIICFISLLRILHSRVKKKALLKIIFISIIAVFSIANTISVNFLFPILMIMIYYDDCDSGKNIANNFFWSLLFWFVITILLNALKILPSNNGIRYGVIRYSLGFAYPGFVGLYFIFICISAYYGFDHGKKILVLLAPFAILFYKLSLSRAGIIGYFVLLISAFLPKKLLKSKFFKTCVLFMFPALTIIVIVFSYLYYQKNLEVLNQLMSGRLLHYYSYIKNGLLTKPFGMFKLEEYTIDNYYLYFFYDFGYIGYTIWLIINHISIKRMKDYKLLIIMLTIFVFGLFDSNAVVSSINFMITIQLMLLVLYKKKGDLIEED